MHPQTVPDASFHTRVRNEALEGSNPFEWKTLKSDDIFGGKRVVLFAVPGAFTPACSESHLPGYERLHDEIIDKGIDTIVCLAVNDAFTLYQWGLSRNIEKVFLLPDGNGEFSRKMGMLVERTSQGLGLRSWRYSMLVENHTIKMMFVEPGFKDNPAGVPLDVSSAENMLNHLTQ